MRSATVRRMMSAPSALRVGTFYHGTGDMGNVSGFRFACEGVLAALLGAPEVERLYAMALELTPERRERFERVHLARPEARSRGELVDLSRLSALSSLPAPLDVLHEMEAHLHRAIAARALLSRRSGRTLPLSIGTHGNHVGGHRLWSDYLPLLLGDVRHGDRVVCASHVSRRAVLRHIEHARAELRAGTGVDVPLRARLEVIPYGIDTDTFRPIPRAEARRALGLDGDAVIVLSHARVNLTNKLDPGPLLVALANLAPQHPRLRLLISTQPTSTLEVVAARARDLGVGDRLGVCVGLPREQVPLLYAASDVVLCLSDTLIENYGLIAVEAMACGVPIVASNWGGYRETVTDGETGIHVPTLWADWDEELDAFGDMGGGLTLAMAAQATANDTVVLERALATLLDDDQLRYRMGAAGRRRALAEFGLDTMARRYVTLWREQIAEANGAGAARPAGISYPRVPEMFADYPSRHLASGDRIAITEHGRALLLDFRSFAPVSGNPIDEQPVRALLAALDGEAAEVGAVLAEAAANAGMSGSALRRHLVWLVKQGCARLAGTSP